MGLRRRVHSKFVFEAKNSLKMKITQLLRYMDGPGGRNSQNGKILGMDLKSIKHHTALVPLFAIMGLGMTWVTYYCFRLASSTTDVNWSKRHEPQEYYSTSSLNSPTHPELILPRTDAKHPSTGIKLLANYNI